MKLFIFFVSRIVPLYPIQRALRAELSFCGVYAFSFSCGYTISASGRRTDQLAFPSGFLPIALITGSYSGDF